MGVKILSGPQCGRFTTDHRIAVGAIPKRRPHGGGRGVGNFPYFAKISTDRLGEMRMSGGEGVKNSKNFADVF